MIDSHMHTKFSSDSLMDIKGLLEKLNEINIGAIITEHMDLKYPVKGKFVFEPKKYFEEYLKYRSKKLFLGIEIGLRDDSIEEYKKIVNQYPFDYVIGSVHFVDNIDIYEKSFYEGKSKKEAYERYFTCMIECLKKYDFMDSLGHIDYISRYSPYNDSEIYYKDFCDYIDQVLKIIIQKDKAFEINTRRFNNKVAINTLKEILNRYKDLGGKYVTIGSDSHRKDNVGNYLKEAYELAEQCELKPVYFKNRKMIY